MKRTSIVAGLAGVLLGALSWAAPAAAQSVSLPAVQLPVTSSSARVALPSTNLQQYPVVLLVPDPATTSPVFFSQGDVTSTASLTTSPVVPGGGICVAASSARTYVAAISASSTTLYVTQMTSCPQFSRGPGSGGGGGAVSSVFGRTGNVVAETNDYNFNQLAGNYTLAQGPTIGAGTVLGSVAGGTPQALTQTQLTALVNTATASLPGAVPAWPNNTTTYFRGDGTYATLNQAAVAGLTPASSPTFAGVTLGAGSAITGSGPGGPLTVVAYSSFGTASGNAAQGGVITAGGPTGSATVAPIITYNAAGQLTAVTSATITPAIGSVTGLGSGVPAALGNTAGGAGGFALVSAANVASVSNSDGTLTISPTTGAVVASIALGHANTWSGQQTFVAPILGTPASGVATNLTGTASGLTAGTVTTNANLTGDVTSVGNATTLATTQTAAHTWSAAQTYSAGEINSTSAASGNSAKQFTGTLLTGAGTTNTLPQTLFQPTGTTAVTTWSTSGTIIGANVVSGFAGNFLDFHVAGAASVFSVSSAGTINASGQITGSIVNAATGFSDVATGYYTWVGRSVLRSAANGSVTFSNQTETNNFILSAPSVLATPAMQLGALDVDTNAAIVAQTLRSQGALAGGTADQAGKNWTFIASPSKGAAAGGSFIFQTTPAGTTGTVVNAPVTRVSILPTGGLSVGSATLTLTGGAFGMDKIIASGSAPGAGGGKLELVCGTNSGTAKLIIAAGTSATAVTVIDNIGAGVTGC